MISSFFKSLFIFLKESVWGVAYHVTCDEALKKINEREKRFTQHITPFYCNTSSMPKPEHVTVYIGSEERLNLGPAPIADMAQQIAVSTGPSGKNSDYLIMLHKWMKENVPEQRDEHLYELTEAVQKLLNS